MFLVMRGFNLLEKRPITITRGAPPRDFSGASREELEEMTLEEFEGLSFRQENQVKDRVKQVYEELYKEHRGNGSDFIGICHGEVVLKGRPSDEFPSAEEQEKLSREKGYLVFMMYGEGDPGILTFYDLL